MTANCGDVLCVRVAPDGWNGAFPVDIERLLEDTASHINRELRNPVTGTISVRSAPSTDRVPRTLIRYSEPGFYVVQLTATERRWSQYVYEFAHEFCHIVIDPYRGEGPSTQWLEEAVCELASVFVLRRMAERWLDSAAVSRTGHPILPRWLSMRDSDWMKPERSLPSDVSLADWFSANEGALRQDPYQRDQNALIAYNMVPIFEALPESWNAIQRLPADQHPTTDSPTRAHLQSWRAAVDPRDRHVVDQVMQLLGVL